MRQFKEGEALYNLVRTAIPDFVESEYPVLVEFIEAFARFLESERVSANTFIAPAYGRPRSVQSTTTYGGPAFEARKLPSYRDVATTLEDFKSHFFAMFAKNFPQHSYVSTDVLIRSLRQFYERKGTPESIEWFFRAFFNKEAEIYFPREDVLKASDGTWIAPITLKVSAPIANPETGETPTNAAVSTFYKGQRIQTTTGSAQVEKVVTTIVGQSYNQNIIVNELTLKFGTILGTFEPDQVVHNIDSDDAVYTTILPVISGATIASGGSNYLPGDLVSFSEGPAGGYGYGAYGVVGAVASTALNGVVILDGGSGFVTGLPLQFTSTTGSGAAAVVSEVITGEILLEDVDSLLDEDGQTFLILEDENTLLLELTIDPFVNATSTITLDSSDYGTDSGIAQLNDVVLDSAIEIALAAADEKPFMHPWVFTDSGHTTAELANAAVKGALVSNTAFFANGVQVFRITSPTDVTTNVAAATLKANVIVSDIHVGAGYNMLYLKEFTGLSLLTTGVLLKQTGNGTLQTGTITTNGTANVVGTNTSFTTLVANTHLRFGDGSHHVVRTVVNNTFLQTFAPTDVTLASNTFSVIPVANVTQVIAQEQRYHGRIRQITLTSSGSGYETPPFVVVESASGQAQELFYYEDTTDEILSSNGQITVYANASLEAQQSAGQITTVTIQGSGVNYTDANAVIVTAIHGDDRTGLSASITPVLGALSHYPGYFTTTRGFLSSNKYLQDSEFYNNYTYVVRVAESFDRYEAMLLKLMHPAGFKALGQFVEVQEADSITLDADATVDTL